MVTLLARGELCLKLLLLLKDTKRQAINAPDLTAGTLSTRRASYQDQWPRLPDLSKESILLFLLIFSVSLVFVEGNSLRHFFFSRIEYGFVG